jgi:antirestriction protein
MRIYATSLDDYNNGVLHGVWIDVEDTTMENVLEQINAMLAASPTEPETAEEWEIHDVEGIPRGLVWKGLPKILEFAEYSRKYEDIMDPFYYWVDDGNIDNMDEFLEYFVGEYKSTQEFVEEYLDDLGYLQDLPAIIEYNIDFEGVWTDFKTSGDYYEIKNANNTVYIYRG